MEQSDYDRLQRDRDNWKASAISAIERAEKAEAKVEQQKARADLFRDRVEENTKNAENAIKTILYLRADVERWHKTADERSAEIVRLDAAVERLKKAIEIACKHWRQQSDMLGAAMDALCDHVGIE